MRVLHVIATGPGDLMGVTTALRGIAQAQAAIGMDVCIVALGAWPEVWREGLHVVNSSARDLPGALHRLAGVESVIHTHVPWRMPALAPIYMRRLRRRFVHSPHGSLAPAAMNVRSRRKTVAWRTLFRRALQAHDLLLVNSPAERDDVRAAGVTRPVVCVPHPLADRGPTRPVRRDRATVAFLGRIHPIKGVLELVQAWRALGPEVNGWTLDIAGPVEDADYMREVRAAAAGGDDVRFFPPLFGEDRWRYLANATIVAVPSWAENFCYVVAEALSVGTPVLTTTGVPWPAIDTMDLGWRGPGTAAALRGLLSQAVESGPEALAAKGERGRAYVEAELRPGAVAIAYERAYRLIH